MVNVILLAATWVFDTIFNVYTFNWQVCYELPIDNHLISIWHKSNLGHLLVNLTKH